MVCPQFGFMACKPWNVIFRTRVPPLSCKRAANRSCRGEPVCPPCQMKCLKMKGRHMGLPLLCGYLQIDKYYAELTFFVAIKRVRVSKASNYA